MLTAADALRPLYAIDAGGSTTRVLASDGSRWVAPSVNPSSVGLPAATQSLSGVFEQIARHADTRGGRPALWLASASLDPTIADEERPRLVGLARGAGLLGELVISNDVTPLLLDVAPGVGHVVAVCGTGSGFTACDGTSPPCRIGGCEYLGSDEGSAFDIGLRGLRAAVRGLDGRGEPTLVAGLLAGASGQPVAQLARALAGVRFPKSAVAALAPAVLAGWQRGDAVAGRIVEDAIGELVLGVRAGRDAAGLSPGWWLSATGGVLTGCPEFFDAFAAATKRLGPSTRLITDPAAAILSVLARYGSVELPAHLGRDARRIDLDEPARTAS